MLVKYEYQPRKFAFGQLDDESFNPNDRNKSVKVVWMTRRRHLPKTIEVSKLRFR